MPQQAVKRHDGSYWLYMNKRGDFIRHKFRLDCSSDSFASGPFEHYGEPTQFPCYVRNELDTYYDDSGLMKYRHYFLYPTQVKCDHCGHESWQFIFPEESGDE